MSNYQVTIEGKHSSLPWDDVISIASMLRDLSGFTEPTILINDINVLDNVSNTCNLAVTYTIVNCTVKHDSQQFVKALQLISENYPINIVSVNK